MGAHSKEAAKMHALNTKFFNSPAGKKLIKEWKDVGRVLKHNIKKTPNGLYFKNGAMKKLSNELDDVADHYDYLGTTHWKYKYDAAGKALLTNPQATNVKFAAKIQALSSWQGPQEG